MLEGIFDSPKEAEKGIHQRHPPPFFFHICRGVGKNGKKVILKVIFIDPLRELITSFSLFVICIIAAEYI